MLDQMIAMVVVRIRLVVAPELLDVRIDMCLHELLPDVWQQQARTSDSSVPGLATGLPQALSQGLTGSGTAQRSGSGLSSRPGPTPRSLTVSVRLCFVQGLAVGCLTPSSCGLPMRKPQFSS